MQILVQLVPTFEYILQVEIYICTLNSHNSKLSSICNMYHIVNTLRATVCPKSSGPLYIVNYYNRVGHYFLDIQYSILLAPCLRKYISTGARVCVQGEHIKYEALNKLENMCYKICIYYVPLFQEVSLLKG